VNYAASFHVAPGMSDMDFVPEPGGLSLYYVVTGSGQVRKVTFPTQPIPTASAPLRYLPLAAAERVFDSRRAVDGGVPLTGNAARTIAMGVDGATTRAVLVNIAYVEPGSSGFLTAWAAGATQPFTSNVNALEGEVVANATVVPSGASGVAHNLTLVNNAGAGFVTAFPDGGVPFASTANASGPDQLRAASAFTRMGADSQVRYYSMLATDLVVDITGWFEG
jgi:hypothetical protein